MEMTSVVAAFSRSMDRHLKRVTEWCYADGSLRMGTYYRTVSELDRDSLTGTGLPARTDVWK